mgnify:FL=1
MTKNEAVNAVAKLAEEYVKAGYFTKKQAGGIPSPEQIKIITQAKEIFETYNLDDSEVECSLELDYEFANESI